MGSVRIIKRRERQDKRVPEVRRLACGTEGLEWLVKEGVKQEWRTERLGSSDNRQLPDRA